MKGEDRLTVGQKIKLLSGADVWHTRAFKECGVESVTFSDGPAGLRKQTSGSDILGRKSSVPATSFPAHSSLARSWSKPLVRAVARGIGEEAADNGVDVVLAPAVNIKRSPLCGRGFEYFSEDGYASGKLGAEFCKGLKEGGAAACVKHFAANNRERARMVCDSEVDERTLREIYLLPFEIAVKEGEPAAVMTAYNLLNGTPCNQNSTLIRDILRGLWGFSGAVVSDWGGTHDRVEAIKAGADLEMPACKLSEKAVAEALERGEIDEGQIDFCARNIINLSSAAKGGGSCNYTAHAELAKKAAAECAVLLKNDGVLPLEKGKKFALIGEFARRIRTAGGGSSKVNPLGEADLVREFLPCDNFLGYAKGGGAAVRLAKRADVVIYVLADEEETEGADFSDIFFPEKQLKLLEKLSKINKNIVAVACCGGAKDTSFDALCRALLLAGLSGQGSAAAIRDVISGVVNPSGKLSETFPYNLDDLPASKTFGKDVYSEPYSERLGVGYRGVKSAKYAFGFGLSYTKFTYSDLRITDGGAIVNICNSGDMYGGEIVEGYVRLPANAASPHMRLFGFEKVFLAAGESKDVFLPFDEYTFRSYDTASKSFAVAAGEYDIFIGSSSDDIRLSAKVEKVGISSISPPQLQISASKYPLKRDKKGRVLAELSTPVAELKHARGAGGRLIARIILRYCKKGGAAGGTLEYLPLRCACQFARFSVRQSEGFLQLFNGHFFKGLAKIIFPKRSKNDR